MNALRLLIEQAVEELLNDDAFSSQCDYTEATDRKIAASAWELARRNAIGCGSGVDDLFNLLYSVGRYEALRSCARYNPEYISQISGDVVSPDTFMVSNATWAMRKEASRMAEETRRTVSLDRRIGDGGQDDDNATCYVDMLKDNRTDSPEETLSASEMLEDLKNLINRLPNGEQKMAAKLYTGLFGTTKMNQSEIAARLGVTKQRVWHMLKPLFDFRDARMREIHGM